MKVFWDLLVEFWNVDDPPRPIGVIGFAMMGAFLLFCVVVLWLHDTRLHH